MSIKGIIAKLLPQSLLNRLLINKDRKQLQSLESIECDATHLAAYSAEQVTGFFSSKQTSTDWAHIAKRINEFQIPDMTGGVNPGDRRAIYFLAKAIGAQSVLEVGTHIGASTIHLASAVRENCDNAEVGDGNKPSPQLTSVDIADVNDEAAQPWLQHGSGKSPRAMVDELDCQFVEFKTTKSLSYMQNCQQRFDLIFLDGDHAARTTYQEIPAALKLLKPDGAILLHDYFPNLQPLWSNGVVLAGPCLAAERLTREIQQLQVIPFGDLPWPTKLGTNRTSLALLCRASDCVGIIGVR